MRYMVWQLTNKKLNSIRLPPMEPMRMLWLVQQNPPASMQRRNAMPWVRNRPQVPTVVPMMGSHCTGLVIPGMPSPHTSTRKNSITQGLRVRPEMRVRAQLRPALRPAVLAPISRK
ncbi:hypothetical protein D3C79_942860 [compost metagenome]